MWLAKRQQLTRLSKALSEIVGQWHIDLKTDQISWAFSSGRQTVRPIRSHLLLDIRRDSNSYLLRCHILLSHSKKNQEGRGCPFRGLIADVIVREIEKRHWEYRNWAMLRLGLAKWKVITSCIGLNQPKRWNTIEAGHWNRRRYATKSIW